MTLGKYMELSVAQRTNVWRRWKAGESLHTIGRPSLPDVNSCQVSSEREADNVIQSASCRSPGLPGWQLGEDFFGVLEPGGALQRGQRTSRAGNRRQRTQYVSENSFHRKHPARPRPSTKGLALAKREYARAA
jgi:hypothetical protein